MLATHTNPLPPSAPRSQEVLMPTTVAREVVMPFSPDV